MGGFMPFRVCVFRISQRLNLTNTYLHHLSDAWFAGIFSTLLDSGSLAVGP